MRQPVTPSIALDGTLFDAPTTGIGLYTRELAKALLALGARCDVWGSTHSGTHHRGTRSRSLWYVNTLPELLKTDRPEVFHAVSNFTLPLRRVKGVAYVLTVHDLIPWLFPDTVSRAFRWQFRLWLTRSLALADRVICVSHVTRGDLLRHFAVDAEKVRVVHHGIDHVDQVPAPDETSVKYLAALGLPEHFVLYAGALEARKNVELVLEAALLMQKAQAPTTVVLAGQRWFGAGAVEKKIASFRAQGLDIRTLGYLEAPVFYALMRQAGAVVFPSRYEGFGLPPLEAMRLGVPTVVSTCGALPEVCGEGARYVHPDDARGLASTLLKLTRDAGARATAVAEAKAQAAHFEWKVAAMQTLAVYREAVAANAARG
jgi:glycosyltransferase involved in cell wall biosynthesis